MGSQHLLAHIHGGCLKQNKTILSQPLQKPGQGAENPSWGGRGLQERGVATRGSQRHRPNQRRPHSRATLGDTGHRSVSRAERPPGPSDPRAHHGTAPRGQALGRGSLTLAVPNSNFLKDEIFFPGKFMIGPSPPVSLCFKKEKALKEEVFLFCFCFLQRGQLCEDGQAARSPGPAASAPSVPFSDQPGSGPQLQWRVRVKNTATAAFGHLGSP